MDRVQKKELVTQYNDTFSDSSTLIVVHYKGLTVSEMTNLRNQVRSVGVEFSVIKNSLAQLAVKGTDFDVLSDKFSGPTAIAYSTDPVAAAKAVVEFSKENEKLIIICGALGTQVMDEKQVLELAKMPSLDELRAKLIGMINTPATRIARLVKEPSGKVARVLNAYSNEN